MQTFLRVGIALGVLVLAASFATSAALEEIGGSAAGTPAVKTKSRAPDFVGINHWINSEPLTMAQLRGKVVLVDFWTYACGNCMNTLPHVTRWYDTYKDRGFVVVGVHTPELAFEYSTSNVQTAVERHGIKYPVAQDNEYATWKAYDNQYWPAEYLIDQNGTIVLEHFGEGGYEEMESTIRRLLHAP